MRLGAELFCTNCIHVDPTTFVEMSISIGGKTLPASRGRDEFEDHASFEPGCRLAATGRLSVFNKSPLLFRNQVRPAWLIEAPNLSLSSLSVGLRSNLFLDSTFLMNNLSLTVIVEPNGIEWSVELSHPKLGLEWLSRGTFAVQLPAGLWLPIA